MNETFKVYLNRKDEVEKSLVKLSKKATKYHIPFSWRWGDVTEERVQVLVPTPCQTPNGGVATMMYPVHKYWVKAQDNDFSDYMSNCRAICQCQSVESKRFGYLCYLPVAYDKAMEREREKMAKATAESCSQYLGEVGKRLDIVVKEIHIVTSWESVYGTTFIYKIVDNCGNVLTWKTSVMVPEEVKTLKGTVKAHNEYKGIKQTELTRCKVC